MCTATLSNFTGVGRLMTRTELVLRPARIFREAVLFFPFFKYSKNNNILLFCKQKKSKNSLQMSPNSKPFRCDICNFTTFTAIGLDQHRSHHGIKAPYNCSICNCEAFSIAGLNHHKAKKHPLSSSPNIGPSVSSSAEHSKTKTEVAQLPTKMLKPINVKVRVYVNT